MCTPAEHTEYGMKGMGEGGAISPPAAIANAVRDALAGLGAELCETPITPRRVLQAIHIAENRNGVSGGGGRREASALFILPRRRSEEPTSERQSQKRDTYA